MATLNVEINNETWTQVLDGDGFAIATVPVLYSFADSAAITDSFTIPAYCQVNGITGQMLFAKSPVQDTINISVTAG